MLGRKNFDSVFTRSIVVGLSSFLYDVLQISDIIKDEIRYKRIKFFYSISGEEQFLTDYYLNTDKYCTELKPIEGNIREVPSGILNITSVSILQQDMASGYIYAKYQKTFDTEFSREERDMAAHTDFIPLQYNFDAKIVAGSDLERLKLMDAVIKKFYKVKRFKIRYDGFLLPVMVSFPEDYSIAKELGFKYPADNKRPELKFTLQVVSWLPVVDLTTERPAGNTIQEFDNTITPEITPPSETESTGIDINDQYQLTDDEKQT